VDGGLQEVLGLNRSGTGKEAKKKKLQLIYQFVEKV
jgi:hypothetical protein